MDRGEIRPAGRTVNLARALCAALAALLCLAAFPAAAQNIATTSGSAQVVVIRPLTMVKARDLSFGKILPGTAAGTVTVAAATGTCTASAAVQSFGTCRSAEFVGMGQQGAWIRLQANGTTQLTGPGAPMTLSNLTIDASPDLSPTILQAVGIPIYRINPASGIFDFRVGGRLQVNANQAPGIYTGMFNVTYDYF